MSDQQKQIDDMNEGTGGIGHSTISAFCKRKGIVISESFLQKIGHKCTKKCNQKGITIGEIPYELYVGLCTYPESLILDVIEKWADE